MSQGRRADSRFSYLFYYSSEVDCGGAGAGAGALHISSLRRVWVRDIVFHASAVFLALVSCYISRRFRFGLVLDLNTLSVSVLTRDGTLSSSLNIPSSYTPYTLNRPTPHLWLSASDSITPSSAEFLTCRYPPTCRRKACRAR